MGRRIALLVVAVLGAVAVLLAIRLARGPEGEAREGPRAVHLGEEQCARCLMIASDARFVAERVRGADDVKVYDDPGCLLRELAADRSGALYFADGETGAWIAAADARFVITERATPMGYGLAATPASRAARGSLDLEAAIRHVVDAKEKD